MNRTALWTLCLSMASLALPTNAADWADECRRLYQLSDVSHAVEPGMLVEGTDTFPSHCRVRGVINRAIRFETTMPVGVEWNGRLMFTAQGGTAGSIGDTMGMLPQGFAMASTDTGHDASEGPAFFAHPEAFLDFAYRANHLATQASKRIIERFYQRDIDYSYVQGCSNGGRAAVMEALRYPEDFDGVIAGAPNFSYFEVVAWMHAMHLAVEANPLSKEALRTLDNASREACDLLDGVEDGVIGDPRQCTEEHFDPRNLVCAEGQTTNCLTPGELKTALVAYGDMVDADGNVVSPGVTPGAEAAGDWAAWLLPHDRVELSGGLPFVSLAGDIISHIKQRDPRTGLPSLASTTFDIESFDPNRDRAQFAPLTVAADIRSTDFSEFRDRGGKLLLYQGWHDVPTRATLAMNFFEQVQETMGGPEPTADFFRLFLVPGMVHCAGGPGAWLTGDDFSGSGGLNYVEPIVAWRERGEAPDRIIGRQPGPMLVPHLVPDPTMEQTRRFTRPQCPYPQFAKYTGRGDENDAANFECVVE